VARAISGVRQHRRQLKTLRAGRAAGRFVGELDKALEPYANDEGSAVLLPTLQEIVRYGPEDEFAAFVQACRAGFTRACTRRERSQKSSYAVLNLCRRTSDLSAGRWS
jgi:hypothetical protein